jgi:hypothetical protein
MTCKQGFESPAKGYLAITSKTAIAGAKWGYSSVIDAKLYINSNSFIRLKKGSIAGYSAAIAGYLKPCLQGTIRFRSLKEP